MSPGARTAAGRETVGPKGVMPGDATALLVLLGPAALVVVLAWSTGGYLARSWGWLAFVGALGLGAAVAAGRRPCGRAETAWIGAFGGLVLWQLLSTAWTTGDHAAVAAAELSFVYLLAAAALLVGGRRPDVPLLVGGVTAATAIVSVAGLAGHLLPAVFLDEGERMTYTRLAGPMGYANAAGILAGICLLLSIGLVTHAGRAVQALAAAGGLLSGLTLYLTLSRGSIVAVAVAAVVLIVADRRRLDVAVSGVLVLVPLAIAIVLAQRLPGIAVSSSYEAAREDGRTLALELVPLIALALAAGFLRSRVPTGSPASRRRVAVAAAALVLVAAAVLLVEEGGPASLVDRAVESFTGPPEPGAALDDRLLDASGDARFSYWRVAGGMVARQPLLGEGAGSFERWWIEDRPREEGAKNAHNLYLETLAETGPVGLVLVLVAVAVPLLAIRRARGVPLAPVAGAAFAAVAVHAALDWDWQIPLVMLTALPLGAAVLLAARAEGDVRGPTSARVRGVALAGCVVAIAAAATIHIGNRALGRAEDALAAGDAATAVDEARRAHRWLPWSSVPWQLRGEAEALGDDVDAARASYRRALGLDPESWLAWFGLAEVVGGAERANAITRAGDLNPTSSEVAAYREP